MIGDTYHDSETTIYNAPALCIPHIDTITFPGNLSFEGTVNGQVIYMHLTSSTGPEANQLNQISTMPIITDDSTISGSSGAGFTYGGQALEHPARVVPKLVLEGYIDTPCTQQGEWYVSQVIDTNGIRYMYPEILAMMIEGRANIQADSSWDRLDPLWYRDPYGRVYNNPRITSFSGNYVEGVPERVQINMTLRL